MALYYFSIMWHANTYTEFGPETECSSNKAPEHVTFVYVVKIRKLVIHVI